ncbi:hypothetical protein JCM3774_001217 [Rhodotorula dairenensis]
MSRGDVAAPAPVRHRADHTLAILIPLLVVSTVLLLFLFLATALLLHRRRRGIELAEEGGPTNLEREDRVDGEGGLDGVEARWLQTVDESVKMGYIRAKIWQTQYPPDSQPTEITLSQFLSIQEKGVSAWSFEPDYESNPAIIVESRTEITFLADGQGMAPEEGGGCSVQSNLPVPKLNDVYYFECKMYEKPPATNVSIGLATKPYPSFRMPGVSRYSVGYHSQDGFKSHSFPFTATSYGPVLLEGDTLGVGYRPRTGTVFFTRNGKKLEDAFVGFNKRNVFPTIGADGPCSVHVNLGQAGYVFIEANVKKWGLAPMMGTLAPPPAYGSERGSILLETAATSSAAADGAPRAHTPRHRRTSSLNTHIRASSAAAAAALSSPTQPIRPSPLRHSHSRQTSSASVRSAGSTRRDARSDGDGSADDDSGGHNPPTPGLLDISLRSMHRFPDRSPTHIHEADEEEEEDPSATAGSGEEDRSDDAEDDDEQSLLRAPRAQNAADQVSARSVSPPEYHPVDPNMYAPGVAETILEDVLGRAARAPPSARTFIGEGTASVPSDLTGLNPRQQALDAYLAQQRRSQHSAIVNDVLSRPLLAMSGRSSPSFGTYEARTEEPASGAARDPTNGPAHSIWSWLTGRSTPAAPRDGGGVDVASQAEEGLAKSVSPAPLGPNALAHPQDLAVRVIRRSEAVPGVSAASHKRSSLSPKRPVGRNGASPSQPRWDDRFILSFRGHEGRPVTLSLRPSADLIPSRGVRSVQRWRDDASGEWRTSEQVLEREAIRAYEGWVVREDEDLERWVREEEAGVVRPVDASAGWARIVLTDTGDELDHTDTPVRFQGAYSQDGELFTIHSTERYLRTREPLDPEPSRLPVLRKRAGSVDEISYEYPTMVIVRDQDLLTLEEQAEALAKRGLVPVADSSVPTCSHDQLAFNTDPAHPVYLNSEPTFNMTTPWFPFSPFSSPRETLFTPADLSVTPAKHAYMPRGHTRVKRQGNDIPGSNGQSSNFINSIGSTAGCPKQQRVVFVGVAADCTYVQAFNSPAAAREQILTDFGSVSALYQRSFNVSLGIVELVVMNSSCPTTAAQVDQANAWNVPCQSSSGAGGNIGVDLNSRLSIFSQWRGDKGGGDGAGLWHLLTACKTASEVGVAWLGQLCRVTASGSNGQVTSGTGVTATTRNEWQVIAHEIGHNFGAIHDCAAGCSLSGSCCPLSSTSCNANSNYIMSPVSEKNVSAFSPCSIGNICTTLSSSLNTTCLASPGAPSNPPLISLQSCGNGILEEGEECDPGQNVDDPCCDASTCRFAPGAVCDPRNSLCCTSQCQMASNGTVCRAAVDSRCDLVETCNGTSVACPDDKYRNDGSSCGDGLSCASGVCTSRDEQCQNAGTSLGLTTACSTSTSGSCNIACRDPRSSLSCIILDQSFRDGTACGNGGRCRGGSCQTGSGLDRAKGWYRDHLNIAIPVTIVVGLIVLALLWGLLSCLCCRGRRGGFSSGKKVGKNQSYSAAYANNGGYGGYGNSAYSNGAYGNGGSGYYPPPPGPPPGPPSARLLFPHVS